MASSSYQQEPTSWDLSDGFLDDVWIVIRDAVPWRALLIIALLVAGAWWWWRDHRLQQERDSVARRRASVGEGKIFESAPLIVGMTNRLLEVRLMPYDLAKSDHTILVGLCMMVGSRRWTPGKCQLIRGGGDVVRVVRRPPE